MKWSVSMTKTTVEKKHLETVCKFIDVLIDEVEKTTLLDLSDRMKCLKHQINMFHQNAHLLVSNFNSMQIMLQHLVKKIH